MVSVKKSGKHVTNSPFKIMVGQSEIGDASKVKVSGKGLVEGHTFEISEFIVDTRTAGKGKCSSWLMAQGHQGCASVHVHEQTETFASKSHPHHVWTVKGQGWGRKLLTWGALSSLGVIHF